MYTLNALRTYNVRAFLHVLHALEVQFAQTLVTQWN